MRGATEYAGLFTVEQIGRLYIVPGCHARGETLHIYVMPSEEPFRSVPWACADAVEVYGITGGQPGWTETYGWLHTGKWQDDFAALVVQRREAQERARIQRENDKAASEAAHRERTSQLLKGYV